MIFSHDIVATEPMNRHSQTLQLTGIHLSPHRQKWLSENFTHHSALLLVVFPAYLKYILKYRIKLLPCATFP